MSNLRIRQPYYSLSPKGFFCQVNLTAMSFRCPAVKQLHMQQLNYRQNENENQIRK